MAPQSSHLNSCSLGKGKAVKKVDVVTTVFLNCTKLKGKNKIKVGILALNGNPPTHPPHPHPFD